MFVGRRREAPQRRMPVAPAQAASELEQLVESFQGVSHRVLKCLKLEEDGFRAYVLHIMVKQLDKYLTGSQQYRFDDHCNKFEEELAVLYSRRHVESPPNLRRDVKPFVLACAIVVYQMRFGAATAKAFIPIEDFKTKFNSVSKFAHMSEENWKETHTFGNLLRVAINAVRAKNNKQVLLESCALLLGIDKCLFGSQTGEGVTRLSLILEEICPETRRKPRIAPTTPLEGISLQEVLAEWARCNPDKVLEGSTVCVGNDQYHFSSVGADGKTRKRFRERDGPSDGGVSPAGSLLEELRASNLVGVQSWPSRTSQQSQENEVKDASIEVTALAETIGEPSCFTNTNQPVELDAFSQLVRVVDIHWGMVTE